MAAAMKAQKTGLLELRVTVDRWIRVLATLTEDTLTVNPSEASEEPAKPAPAPVGALNGDPPNLSSSPVPETITNVKRTVRVTKQDVGGLGISIKGETFILFYFLRFQPPGCHERRANGTSHEFCPSSFRPTS